MATTEDAVIEGNETFTVSLAVSGTTAPVTATDTATGTITNDDATSTGITLAVSPESVAEDAGATTVTVTAMLNDAVRASATPVTVAVGAASDAATEGTDYTAVSDLTMSIVAGNTADTVTFSLTPTDDAVVEGDETLSISGTTAVTTLTLTNTEVTLTDDDGSAAVTIDNASANEGDTITFTVTLDKAVQGGLTVTPSVLRRDRYLRNRLYGEHGGAQRSPAPLQRDKDHQGGHHRGRGDRGRRDVHGQPGRVGHDRSR